MIQVSHDFLRNLVVRDVYDIRLYLLFLRLATLERLLQALSVVADQLAQCRREAYTDARDVHLQRLHWHEVLGRVSDVLDNERLDARRYFCCPNVRVELLQVDNEIVKLLQLLLDLFRRL